MNPSVTVGVATLTVGWNVFYVRMRTSDSCTTVSTAMDSVSVVLNEPGGSGRMIDLDNPGQPIIAGPNPVRGRLSIYGLMSQELVRQQVEGQTQTS